MKYALKKAARTLLQLTASGGLTALIDQIAGGLSVQDAALILTGWGVLVTFIQNFLEDTGVVPKLLR